MIKKLLLNPAGWECPLKDLRPGLFLFGGKHVGYKSEYEGKAYNQGGEYLCIDDDSLVQPVEPEWEFEEV